MLTGKQRANLRKVANNLDAIFQIGKGGIEQALIKHVDEALEAREMIKLRILPESSDVSSKEAAEILSTATNSDVVQVIGSRFVLYRRNPKKPKFDDYLS